MMVGILTTCHTQYTWDRSIWIFLFNRTTLPSFCYVPYKCSICAPFVIRQMFCVLTNVSTQNVFLPPLAAILVSCVPSGEMHNYCTPHIKKENFENFLIHQCNYILLSQVYCVWEVVKTPKIISNNPVYCEWLLLCNAENVDWLKE